jgi:hypothetical protein
MSRTACSRLVAASRPLIRTPAQDYSSFGAAPAWPGLRSGTPAAMSYELKAGHPACAQGAGFHAPARPTLSRRPIARRPANVEPAVEVVDDLPALVPVTQGEIEVIEIYLGALLDEALAGMGSEVSRRREPGSVQEALGRGLYSCKDGENCGG